MLNEFIGHMKQQGKAVYTVNGYWEKITLYMRWCEDSFGSRPDQLYRANVLEYISYMRNNRGYCNRTVNNHLSALRCYNEDLVAKEIYVTGKGDKFRTVYINDKTVHAIKEYLKVRKSDGPYLFVSRVSEKMAMSRINQIFNEHSDVITPRMLRHFFCTNALESGDYKIHEVANQAGHGNVQTTLIYSNPSARQMKEKTNKL